MGKDWRERTEINLLFIIADQFRADLLSGEFAKCVATPNLDSLAASSLRLTNHHTVAVPCGPARASLLTGLYPSEHGALRNGAPLKNGLSNFAHQLRRIGREPLLFGYTDTQPNPSCQFARDPARNSYTAPMEGFTEVVEMREEAWRWLAYLRAEGYDVPHAQSSDFQRLYQPVGQKFGGPALYDARHSDTAFLTDATIQALDVRRSQAWTAFVTYIRPHPPYVAPAPYHKMIDPDSVPAPLKTNSGHAFLAAQRDYPSNAGIFWGYDGNAKDLDAATIARVRATYLGLVAELDDNIGRLFNWLDATGQRNNTAIVFTSDHGDMLGDFGLWGKLAPFPQASHIPFMVQGPDIAPEAQHDVTQSTEVMSAILQYLEGGMVSFEGLAQNETAKIEFSLTHPTKPTPFQRAGLATGETAGCTVFHDARSRIATFDCDMPDLQMSTLDGSPVE